MALSSSRYRLYREHKYLFFMFSQLLQLVATLDLSREHQIDELKKTTKNLQALLESHAHYEETRIHSLLKAKNSLVFQNVELEHRQHTNFFNNLNKQIDLLQHANQDDIYFMSYELYLELRYFFADTLKHFDTEEKILMPELQRLFTDEELKVVDKISYSEMSSSDLVDMMSVLFPHMNCDDRASFLLDIKECEPEKFLSAWQGISTMLDSKEKAILIRKFDLPKS